MDSLAVALNVSADLLAPKGFVRGRPLEQVAVVTMEKASMDKDNSMVAGQNDVRSAGEFFCVQPETKPIGMQAPAHRQFRPRISTTDCCHIAAAGRRVMNVSH